MSIQAKDVEEKNPGALSVPQRRFVGDIDLPECMLPSFLPVLMGLFNLVVSQTKSLYSRSPGAGLCCTRYNTLRYMTSIMSNKAKLTHARTDLANVQKSSSILLDIRRD